MERFERKNSRDFVGTTEEYLWAIRFDQFMFDHLFDGEVVGPSSPPWRDMGNNEEPYGESWENNDTIRVSGVFLQCFVSFFFFFIRRCFC
jgi:hypothetical protein